MAVRPSVKAVRIAAHYSTKAVRIAAHYSTKAVRTAAHYLMKVAAMADGRATAAAQIMACKTTIGVAKTPGAAIHLIHPVPRAQPAHQVHQVQARTIISGSTVTM